MPSCWEARPSRKTGTRSNAADTMMMMPSATNTNETNTPGEIRNTTPTTAHTAHENSVSVDSLPVVLSSDLRAFRPV